MKGNNWSKATFMLILLIISVSALTASIIYSVNVTNEISYRRDLQCESRGWGEYIGNDNGGCVDSDGVGRLLLDRYEDDIGIGIMALGIISSIIATAFSLLFFCDSLSGD